MLDPAGPSHHPFKAVGIAGDAPTAPSSTDEQISHSFTLNEETLKAHFASQLNEELSKLYAIGEKEIDRHPRNAQGIDILKQVGRFINDLLKQENIETIITDVSNVRSYAFCQSSSRRTFKIVTMPYNGIVSGNFQKADKALELFYRIHQQLLTLCELNYRFIRDHLTVSICSSDLLNSTKDCYRTELSVEFQ